MQPRSQAIVPNTKFIIKIARDWKNDKAAYWQDLFNARTSGTFRIQQLMMFT